MCQGISDLQVMNLAESRNLEERIDPHVHTHVHTHTLQQLAAVCCDLALRVTLDFNSSEVRYLSMYPWPEVLLHFSGITVSK